ncbi:GNAT family N-acetyltransferase [Legionella anisa]|uniref:GNAT family N-acetyltransferase n=1 Tax=Legionella anisa TaxID=28082 RepID=UPI0010417429|nr:GNAT family N-acetyltransferase [Legionella anisa]
MQKLVRVATVEDLDFIYSSLQEDLEEQGVLHRFTYSKENFKKAVFCDQPLAYFLILIMDEKPAGFVNYAMDNRNFTVNTPSKNLYINDLYVKKSFRRMKGATLLMEKIKEIAVEEGCGRIEGFVLADNAASLAFYQRYLKAKIISDGLHYMRLEVAPSC